MSDILVFNGWGYKSEIWNKFIDHKFDVYELNNNRLDTYSEVHAWSLGVLNCLDKFQRFNSECVFNFYSPCLTFVERNEFVGNSVSSVNEMIAGLKKSKQTVLKLFHRKSKSNLSTKFLAFDSDELEFGLNALKEYNFADKNIHIPKERIRLFSAKHDPIISLKQSEQFAEKYSLPLTVYDTFSHSFFLDRVNVK